MKDLKRLIRERDEILQEIRFTRVASDTAIDALRKNAHERITIVCAKYGIYDEQQ